MVQVGDTAPDFTLEGTHGHDIREFTLSEFAADRPAVLVFYVHDYSPVCTTQMCEVNDMEWLTLNEDIGVLGISTDGPYSHREFIQDNDLTYPLLSDVDMEVYDDYGMISRGADGRRRHKRGIVLLDADRTVHYRWDATDNWARWTSEPMLPIDDMLGELTGQ